MKAADVQPNTIYRVGKKDDPGHLEFVQTTSKPIMEPEYRSDRISHVNAYPIKWVDGEVVAIKRMHVYKDAHYSGTPGAKKRDCEVYALQKIQPFTQLNWPEPVEGVNYGYGNTIPVVGAEIGSPALADCEHEWVKKKRNKKRCEATSDNTEADYTARWEKINLATLELLGIFQPNPINYYEWHHDFDEAFEKHGYVDEIARDLAYDKKFGFTRDRVYMNDLSIDTIEKINDLVNWKEDNAFL